MLKKLELSSRQIYLQQFIDATIEHDHILLYLYIGTIDRNNIGRLFFFNQNMITSYKKTKKLVICIFMLKWSYIGQVLIFFKYSWFHCVDQLL